MTKTNEPLDADTIAELTRLSREFDRLEDAFKQAEPGPERDRIYAEFMSVSRELLHLQEPENT